MEDAFLKITGAQGRVGLFEPQITQNGVTKWRITSCGVVVVYMSIQYARRCGREGDIAVKIPRDERSEYQGCQKKSTQCTRRFTFSHEPSHPELTLTFPRRLQLISRQHCRQRVTDLHFPQLLTGTYPRSQMKCRHFTSARTESWICPSIRVENRVRTLLMNMT